MHLNQPGLDHEGIKYYRLERVTFIVNQRGRNLDLKCQQYDTAIYSEMILYVRLRVEREGNLTY